MLISKTASNFGEIPIGVDVLKRRLQIDDIPENDNELESLLKEAVEAVERYTGVAIRSQTVTLSYDGLVLGSDFEIEAGPITGVVGLPDTCSLSTGSFRVCSGYSYDPFTVVVTAGYGENQVPELLIGAVKKYVENAWFRPNEKNVTWKSLASSFRRPYTII